MLEDTQGGRVAWPNRELWLGFREQRRVYDLWKKVSSKVSNPRGNGQWLRHTQVSGAGWDPLRGVEEADGSAR